MCLAKHTLNQIDMVTRTNSYVVSSYKVTQENKMNVLLEINDLFYKMYIC